MTAERIPDPLDWLPDAARQKPGGFTVDDVLDMPDDAPRIELESGEILVVPTPTVDHQNISALLWAWMRRYAPSGYDAAIAVGVQVTPKDSFEPDVVVHRAEDAGGRHYLTPDEVAIVIEIVSPSTRRRDRFEKPRGYAEAGIPFYWRVEQDPVHVFAYRLMNGRYELMADSAGMLELAEPFEIRLPIALITP